MLMRVDLCGEWQRSVRERFITFSIYGPTETRNKACEEKKLEQRELEKRDGEKGLIITGECDVLIFGWFVCDFYGIFFCCFDLGATTAGDTENIGS